jgi:hypothetical protein
MIFFSEIIKVYFECYGMQGGNNLEFHNVSKARPQVVVDQGRVFKYIGLKCRFFQSQKNVKDRRCYVDIKPDVNDDGSHSTE